MPDVATALTLVGLTKHFGAAVAVHPLHLEVQRGELFALLGPNGAGKTTVVRMVCGFLPPDGGEIRFDGERARPHAPGGDARARVGVCPQELVVWEQLTCLEQLVFMAEMYDVRPRLARARGLELLEALHLGDRANRKAGTLSGGMKRRLNLALALVHDPSVVLLDEPEAGLDPQSRVLVRDFVRGLARRKTVILTSHNMDEVDRMADRVGILHEGRMLVVDTPHNLKRRTGGGDALHIELEAPDDASCEAGRAALEALATGASPVVVERHHRRLVVRSPQVLELVADAVNALRALGVRIRGLSIRETTLEDAFIALTGRSLASEDAEPRVEERQGAGA